MAERTEREKVSFVGRETCCYVPAKSARRTIGTYGVRSCHCCDRHRTKDPSSFINSPGENHLAIDREIISRRKQTGVPRNSTHAKRSWVMDLTTQPLFAFHSGVRAAVAEIVHLAPSFFRWGNASG